MSKPKGRVQTMSGIEGIEKQIALKAASEYCREHGLSLEKLSEQRLHYINEACVFSAPSGIVPDGLCNDIATQSLPVLIVTERDGNLLFQQTNYTRKYLSV